MNTQEFETLLTDINTRLTAIGETVSEAKLKEMVKAMFGEMLNEPDFARKFQFGNQGDERLIGSKYARWGLSVADIEFLYDLQQSLQGQRKVSGSGVYGAPSESLRATFEAMSKAFYLSEDEAKAIDKRAIDDLFPRLPLSAFGTVADRNMAKRGAWEQTGLYKNAIRAMDSAESGYGSQLIGAQYVGDLWDGARKESRIMGLIPSFEMTDPVAYLPIEADLPEMLFVAENTTYNASNYTTSKSGSNRVTVTAKKFIIHQMWSGELEEDSITPFIPFLRRQAEVALAYYGDHTVYNGDTTNAGTGNINLDDADPADTKAYLAFDGIRHAFLVDNTGNGVSAAAAVTFAALINLRGKMVDTTYLFDWGHPTDPNDLVFVCDPDTADRIATIDEVITTDKFGANATVLTGQVGRLGAHPVVSSIAAPKTEADGKVSTTAGNNTLGQVGAFNRRGFVVGWRRRTKIETERIPGADQTRLVHSLRLGFGRYAPSGSAASIEAAAGLYNITLS